MAPKPTLKEGIESLERCKLTRHSQKIHSSRVRMVRIVPYIRYVRILTYLILRYVKGTKVHLGSFKPATDYYSQRHVEIFAKQANKATREAP